MTYYEWNQVLREYTQKITPENDLLGVTEWCIAITYPCRDGQVRTFCIVNIYQHPEFSSCICATCLTSRPDLRPVITGLNEFDFNTSERTFSITKMIDAKVVGYGR